MLASDFLKYKEIPGDIFQDKYPKLPNTSLISKGNWNKQKPAPHARSHRSHRQISQKNPIFQKAIERDKNLHPTRDPKVPTWAIAPNCDNQPDPYRDLLFF